MSAAQPTVDQWAYVAMRDIVGPRLPVFHAPRHLQERHGTPGLLQKSRGQLLELLGTLDEQEFLSNEEIQQAQSGDMEKLASIILEGLERQSKYWRSGRSWR